MRFFFFLKADYHSFCYYFLYTKISCSRRKVGLESEKVTQSYFSINSNKNLTTMKTILLLNVILRFICQYTNETVY